MNIGMYKYLLAYKPYMNGDFVFAYVRQHLNGRNIWAIYRSPDSVRERWVCYDAYIEGPYDTAIEAMNALDKYLIERGYVFVSEDRAEKLLLLL